MPTHLYVFVPLLMLSACQSLEHDDQQGSLSIGFDGKMHQLSSLMRRDSFAGGLSDTELLHLTDHDFQNSSYLMYQSSPRNMVTSRYPAESWMDLTGVSVSQSSTFCTHGAAGSTLLACHQKFGALRATDRRRHAGSGTSGVENLSRRRYTSTAKESSPWWKMTFGGQTDRVITSIRIGNREDCCTDKLNEYQITMRPSNPNEPEHVCVRDGGDFSIDCQVDDFTDPDCYYFHWCNHGLGWNTNAVVVSLPPGSLRILSMSEVTTYGWMNTMGFIATQSSTHRYENTTAGASRAIDNNGWQVGQDGQWSTNSCTMTYDMEDSQTGTSNPWWEVTWTESKTVSSIFIYNRLDTVRERLSGFEVLLRTPSSVPSQVWSTTCASDVEVSAQTQNPIRVLCQEGKGYPATGVKIQLPGNNKILSLCEVKINEEITTAS